MSPSESGETSAEPVDARPEPGATPAESGNTSADLRSRIRPLPANTPEETLLPFVDLCFNWSMDKPTIPREELLTRADARHYFADWGRRGDLAAACYDDSGEEIVGLAWLRLADADAAVSDTPPRTDTAFADALNASAVIDGEIIDEADDDAAGASETADDDSRVSEADDIVDAEVVDDDAADPDADTPADPSDEVDAATASADEVPFAGYGWVAADIPELSIAVLPEYQGQGIGGALLDVLLTLARMSGVSAVSLAVEDGNGAARLYEDRGFVTVGRSGDSDLLVRQLG